MGLAEAAAGVLLADAAAGELLGEGEAAIDPAIDADGVTAGDDTIDDDAELVLVGVPVAVGETVEGADADAETGADAVGEGDGLGEGEDEVPTKRRPVSSSACRVVSKSAFNRWYAHSSLSLSGCQAPISPKLVTTIA